MGKPNKCWHICQYLTIHFKSKWLQLKQIETFRQKFVHQIMLQALNCPNTTRNESNKYLKLMGHQ